MVSSSAQILIEGDLSSDEVFNFVTDIDIMPKVFKGFGPIPGIKLVKNVSGDGIGPGSRREVHNFDGSIVTELVEESRQGELYRYRLISGLRFPFNLMVSEGLGNWSFKKTATGVEITWEFSFIYKFKALAPITFLLVKVFFNKAQKLCLKNIKSTISI